MVKIEVFAAHDPYELTATDLDNDHLQEVSEILQDAESDLDSEPDEELVCKHLRFDLCPKCRKRLTKNPLNRDASLHFDFSEN